MCKASQSLTLVYSSRHYYLGEKWISADTWGKFEKDRRLQACLIHIELQSNRVRNLEHQHRGIGNTCTVCYIDTMNTTPI